MSIKEVWDQAAAPARRKWYDDPSTGTDDSSVDSSALYRLSLRLRYLEKKVSDLELRVESIEKRRLKK